MLITLPAGTVLLLPFFTATTSPSCWRLLVAVAWSMPTRFGTLTCGSARPTTETGSVFVASDAPTA